MKNSYAKKESCNCCGGVNNVNAIVLSDGIVYEAETICKSCGWEDYWCTGSFESLQDGFDNAERYNTEVINDRH